VPLTTDERQALKAFREDLEAVEASREELRKQYPDKWIAFLHGEVRATADSFDELQHELEAKRLLGTESIVVEHLRTEPVIYVL